MIWLAPIRISLLFTSPTVKRAKYETNLSKARAVMKIKKEKKLLKKTEGAAIYARLQAAKLSKRINFTNN